MISKTALILVSMLSVNAFAATTLRNGFYRDEFNHCGMKITNIDGSNQKHIEYYFNSSIPLIGLDGGELVVDPTVKGTTLKAQSPTDSRNKIKIELANDGTAISAKMGGGTLNRFSYSRDCKDLIFVKPL